MLLALFSIVITLYTRKMNEKDKPIIFVWGNAACMVGIVIVTAVGQFNTSTDDKAYKQAVLDLGVLARVNEFIIPVFDNYAEIINNFTPIKNYIYQEQAKSTNPDAVTLIEKQQNRIRAQKSFQVANQALDNLKSIAAKVQSLHMQYGDKVPKEVLEWAGVVSEINLENMDIYFDPYAREGDSPSESVLSFFELSGKAFGVSIGRAKKASETINSIAK